MAEIRGPEAEFLNSDDARLAERETPDQLYERLISSVRKYHPSDNVEMISRAYRIASEAHKGQKRKSGEPYIIHPIWVAIILADLELDKETIIAGILHEGRSTGHDLYGRRNAHDVDAGADGSAIKRH